MSADKRDQCGCHRECTTEPHECDRPCRWPDCLTDAEHAELLASLTPCPECGDGPEPDGHTYWCSRPVGTRGN